MNINGREWTLETVLADEGLRQLMRATFADGWEKNREENLHAAVDKVLKKLDESYFRLIEDLPQEWLDALRTQEKTK